MPENPKPGSGDDQRDDPNRRDPVEQPAQPNQPRQPGQPPQQPNPTPPQR